MSTSGILSILGGYHEYISGCSVHRGFHKYLDILPIYL